FPTRNRTRSHPSIPVPRKTARSTLPAPEAVKALGRLIACRRLSGGASVAAILLGITLHTVRRSSRRDDFLVGQAIRLSPPVVAGIVAARLLGGTGRFACLARLRAFLSQP